MPPPQGEPPDPPGLRMTLAVQQVLRHLLREPAREVYGYQLGQAVGLPPRVVGPMLARLQTAGILTSRIEDIDPRQAGRPRRRYYRFTPDGAERARRELARAYQATHPAPAARRRTRRP